MSFEEYIKAVIDYYMIGGVTWEQAYVRVLIDKRFDIASSINGDSQKLIEKAEEDFPAFLYVVFAKWTKR